MRSFDVGSQSEGCVADDEFPYLYIAEESTGIWIYGAEPGDGDARTRIDSTGSGKQLVPDIEGLSIYYTSVGTGYLIASSQGNSTFVIYQREEGNKYVMTFEIMESAAIDRVSQTDGIDVTNFPLGSDPPQGVFIAQDGNNDPANQNFKLVTWQMTANAADPPLSIDVSWDPRQVGGNGEDVAAMVSSFVISVVLLALNRNGMPVSTHVALLITIAFTTVSWVVTAFVGPETERAVLVDFFRKVRPTGPGWTPIREAAGLTQAEVASSGDNIPMALLGWVAGCIMIWSSLFTVGNFLYGRTEMALGLFAVFVASAFVLQRVVRGLWRE